MNILGISCCFSPLKSEFLPKVPEWFFHDSAAALIRDGVLKAAVEEERLNRIKHTNKFCSQAIRYCLNQENLNFNEIDHIAFFFEEGYSDNELNLQYVTYPDIQIKLSKELLINLIKNEFDILFPKNKIHFVPHHSAHAYSTYYHSGFQDSLVIVIDGQGEDIATTIFDVSSGNFNTLKSYSEHDSLGHFYSTLIQLLGYKLFDEYKVMGLAPYGNPNIYRHLFSSLYTLKPDGDYELHLEGIQSFFLKKGFIPRRKGEPFNQNHKDFAAALQEALEKIMEHILKYWRNKTNHKNLCLAGGVAHNCSMNGTIAYSGLFDSVFVHPAAHDSGAALGAALFIHNKYCLKKIEPQRIKNVYWGPSIGENDNIRKNLEKWGEILEFKKSSDICTETAHLLAQDAVVGWVQGKLEFGPRALGNRSIVADPRPEKNKDRINAMIKKREAYRPFAPSVLEESIAEYFELPHCEIPLEFMIFNLRTKDDKSTLLGAVTHINGTSRVQAVSKKENKSYWNLIRTFGDITGVPILLNTSFNNNHEPIVCSVNDCITSFLTTNLDFLVIDDFLIKKKDDIQNLLKFMKIIVNPNAAIEKIYSDSEITYNINFNFNKNNRHIISNDMYNFLLSYDSKIENCIISSKIYNDLLYLWDYRFINLIPKSENNPQKT